MKVPKSIPKNDEHIKAHRKNNIAMSQKQKAKNKKRSYQIQEYNSTKNSTHLHCFDLKV